MPDVRVVVKPGSRAGERSEALTDGSLVVHLRARPVAGAANNALIAILAAHWGVPKSHLAIVRGDTSRQKVVRRP